MRLDWWLGAWGDARHYCVNDCLYATITSREGLAAFREDHDRGFENLVLSRVAPLVWLAMPGHEDSA